MTSTIKHLLMFLVLLLFLALPIMARAGNMSGLSKGQTLYVPAYSHIYAGNRERAFLLTVTLSIRNIDPRHPITLTKVDYYETEGSLVTRYLKKPLTLNPMASLRYIVPEKDARGGSGANFIVTWNADHGVNPPITESIMIGTQTQQGISFTSRGREIVTP